MVTAARCVSRARCTSAPHHNAGHEAVRLVVEIPVYGALHKVKVISPRSGFLPPAFSIRPTAGARRGEVSGRVLQQQFPGPGVLVSRVMRRLPCATFDAALSDASLVLVRPSSLATPELDPADSDRLWYDGLFAELVRPVGCPARWAQDSALLCVWARHHAIAEGRANSKYAGGGVDEFWSRRSLGVSLVESKAKYGQKVMAEPRPNQGAFAEAAVWVGRLQIC